VDLEVNMLATVVSKLSLGTAAIACALALGGCDSGELPPGNVQLALVQADQSQLRALTSNATQQSMANAFVTITEIDARVHGAGWVPLMTDPTPVDLLHLDKQQITVLGIGKLPTGHVEKLRLILDPKDAFVITKGGVKSPLQLPSGGTLEVVGKLDLDGCAAGTLILDFDPKIRTDADDECSMQNQGCDNQKGGKEHQHDRDRGDSDGKSGNGSGNGNQTHVTYHLRALATLRTEEIKGSCTPGSPPPPAGNQCGNGNTVCSPDQICKNGDCLDPCFGVTCQGGTTCFKGECVSNDPCAQSSGN
jgi:hypothetical protein